MGVDASGDVDGDETMSALSCRSCGTELPLSSNFCSECGARVSVGPSAEYKQVTVLVADVVRSMDLAAKLDPERLRDVMTGLVERSAAVARRFGGGTVEYTGDGVMVLFGAPVAMEDHAFRACLAAMAIQDEVASLAEEVRCTDGVALQLRIGLNSGRVIAGEVGTASPRYSVTGKTVGFAQRMESAALPGGVMVSAETARLVEHMVTLAEAEWVHIKGVEAPVQAQRLLAIDPSDRGIRRTEANLVGRRWEIATLDAALERAIGRRGGVVNVVGPPGIGKSRLAREAAALAARRGAEVFWGFCESHARDIPFHAVTSLLRASSGVTNLDDRLARAKVREQLPDADPQDLLLFYDLLAIGDPNIAPPQINSEVRRRRLTSLINTRALARGRPALFVIEDVHWIDTVSESMLADFLEVIPRTTSMVLITSRPDYDGALLRMPGAQSVRLAPLDGSDTAMLLRELLGSDSSVAELAAVIVERAAGNPFFAEEIVRELAQRGVLIGRHGHYICQAKVTEVHVPATVQAAIEARIDRLSAPAKATLNAASVIGAHFDVDLLAALGSPPVFDELIDAELIDQARLDPTAEYTFRHPLIRAVAYESQLKADRAQRHRRLAAAIGERSPEQADENAALIAEHLEAAGDRKAAYRWHMRAATWSTNRDVAAARLSWERACRIADRLPADESDQLSMRIAPRTMLCATDSQARAVQESRTRFAELQQLCHEAGDKVSLAIGMSALSTELCFAGRVREAARLSSQQMALLETIGDPTATMGLAALAFVNWIRVGEFDEILRWSQKIIDLAGGDPVKGAGFGVGSPLAVGLAWRGTARWWLGIAGWRNDLDAAIAMAQGINPDTLAGVIAWTYGFALHYGILVIDQSVLSTSEDALQAVRRAGSEHSVDLPTFILAAGLLNQEDTDDRRRGLDLLMQVRDIWRGKRALFLLPIIDIWEARETARCGDRDAAIQAIRRAADELREAGNLFYGVWATAVLTEALLERVAEGDLAEAEEGISWIRDVAEQRSSAMCDVTLLRLRALLAYARRDDETYRHYRDRYRVMAKSFGFEQHSVWADEMP